MNRLRHPPWRVNYGRTLHVRAICTSLVVIVLVVIATITFVVIVTIVLVVLVVVISVAVPEYHAVPAAKADVNKSGVAAHHFDIAVEGNIDEGGSVAHYDDVAQNPRPAFSHAILARLADEREIVADYRQILVVITRNEQERSIRRHR